MIYRQKEPHLTRLYIKSFDIARKAHCGQKDKGGEDYIYHPIRVSANCVNLEEKIVALLHDVIEDTDITIDDLRKEGFDEYLVEAILSVTRKDGETYMTFIKRAGENPIGKVVKLADLEDNMDITRLPKLTDRDFSRLKKYHKAYKYLKHLDNKKDFDYSIFD